MAERGAHPEDARQFGPAALPLLREAVRDLSWLRGRGYAETAAVKVVGDRYQLTRRQRTAVARCACGEGLAARRARRVQDLKGRDVWVDGFNLLITLERGLAGGPVLIGRDGACRDLAGVHGTWRAVTATPEALERAHAVLAAAASVTWVLDRPVSNSGRLAGLLRAHADVRLEDRADPVLAEAPDVVVTGDAWILDRAGAWFDAVRPALEGRAVWFVDLEAE